MSLNEVKVSRRDVLELVKENKKKHDAILKDAIEGYWLEAEKFLKKYEKDTISDWEKSHKDQLKRMRKNLRENKKNLKDQIRKELGYVEKKNKNAKWVYMTNPFPESHADDYIGTIRRLELCVDDEIKLDTYEFDKYVRNKWEWRASFLTSNSGYTTSYRSAYALTSSYSLGGATFGTGSCFPMSSSWSGWAGNVGLGTTNPSNVLKISNSGLGYVSTDDLDTF